MSTICARKILSKLARLIGTTNQNLYNRLTRDNFSEQELHKIAEVLGYIFEGFFIFNDNERI